MGKDAAKAKGEVRLLWGSEAVAQGLVESGLDTVSAHESVKATEIALACEAAREGAKPRVEIHLSAARTVESAIAAASKGEPAAVVLPSRSFAAGAAPLHAFCERGTTAGLVVVLIEDPGCEMTPGEIDSRYLARELYMPIIEPGSLPEALEAARAAPGLSESWGQPVMLRLGLRLCDTRGLLDVTPKKADKRGAPPRAVPALADSPLGAYGGEAARTARMNRMDAVAVAAETLPFNRAELTGPAELLIVAAGAAWGPTRDALQLIGMESAVQLVKIGMPFPLPRALLAGLMRKTRRVLVVEELEPYVETRLSEIANKEGISTQVRGKVFISRGGELTTWDVADGLGRIMGLTPPVDDKRIEMLDRVVAQALPPRAPSLPGGHAMLVAIGAAQSYCAGEAAAGLVVEAPPEWRVALTGVRALYFGDWGEGLGVGAAIARRAGAPVVVVTEGRGIVAGLSAIREAQAESLPLVAVVSPEGLSAAVERALPGARHHVLDVRALAAGLGLEAGSIIEVGPAGIPELARALGGAAGGAKGPKILTFGAKGGGGGAAA